ASEDDLLVADPRRTVVLRREALPAHALLRELRERPADGLALGADALEPDLVAVLASDQIDGYAVDRSDHGDAPGIELGVVGANGRVVRLRLLPGLAALAWRRDEDVLDDAAFED